MLSLVECPELRRRLKSPLRDAASHWAHPHEYLDTFLAAVHRLPDLKQYVIQRSDKTLLNREVVKYLNERPAFSFRETRLIDELRQRYPIPQPARYGQKQLPVFNLPAEAIFSK